LRLLPGRWLADIESILRRDSGTRDFEISGMVTEYRGLNYLLMTHALAVEPVAGNPQDGNPQVTSRPDGADGRLPSANEILGAISREVPARALPTPTGSGETSIGGTAPSPADGRSPPDGSILVDRVGRLVRGPKGWMLTLDSGGGPSVEPSIRLLPSRLLETMETASAGGIEHTTFVVGGEVHAFGKESFLILHKVLVRRSLGNLR
jgi:hypothetical protein